MPLKLLPKLSVLRLKCVVKTPHPILGPIMQERSRVFGVAAQTLDRPDRSDPEAA